MGLANQGKTPLKSAVLVLNFKNTLFYSVICVEKGHMTIFVKFLTVYRTYVALGIILKRTFTICIGLKCGYL